MMAVSWAFGPNLSMSEAWPKASTPRSSAVCMAAGLSVCCRYVGALVDQRFGRIGLLAGIVPAVDPDDLDLDVRVDRLGAQHEGVDARHHFRDRERADIAQRRPSSTSCRRSCPRCSGPRRTDRYRSRHSWRACSRWHARTRTFGNFFATFSVGSMKPNEVVKISLLPARASCSMARSAVGTFGYVLDIGRLDLVAERLDHRLAADFVLVGPAEVADRADIDEADLELVGGGAGPNTPAARPMAAGPPGSLSHASSSDLLSGRELGTCRCHAPKPGRQIT